MEGTGMGGVVNSCRWVLSRSKGLRVVKNGEIGGPGGLRGRFRRAHSGRVEGWGEAAPQVLELQGWCTGWV